MKKKVYEFLEQKIFRILKQDKNYGYLKALYPNADTNKKLKEFTHEKIRLCLIIGLICGIIGCLMWIKEETSGEIVYIERNEYLEGKKEEKLSVIHGEDKNEIDITFDFEEREYTQEELNLLYEDFEKELEKEILDKNESFDRVAFDLKLQKSVEGYPFNLEWKIDEEYEEYINKEGVLLKENMEEPQLVVITCRVSTYEFTRVKEIPCLIYGRSEPFSFEYKLKSFLKNLDQKEINERKIKLPSEFEGEKLVWKKQRDVYGKLLFASTPFLMILLFFCKDKDLEKQIKERQFQIKSDYPKIVSKLALYLGAGLTISKAWQRVAESDKSGRFAYEEMRTAIHEMESGIPMNTAYENFGKRCHDSSFTKLVSIIVQNTTKGATNVSAILREEAALAFEERKQEAIKKGEQVGTKMLVPMMLLLFVVLIIVMVPAFMNHVF